MILPPELEQIKVPALILQSLVENAIVHGLELKVSGGSHWITALEQNGQLVLRVADDGVGFKKSADVDPSQLGIGSDSGFGLQQVRERLQSWHGYQNTINFIALCAVNTPANDRNSIKNTGKKATLVTRGCEVTLCLPMTL